MWQMAHTITSQKHDFGAQILLLTENVGFQLIDGSLVLINTILAFMTNKYSPDFSIVFQKICFFDADFEKVCYS